MRSHMNVFLLSLVTVLTMSCTSFAGTAFDQQPEKITLFEAGQNQVALYRIPGIAVTPKGTVLAWCEARKNSRSDWGEIEVHLRRSLDGGKSWEPAVQIAHHAERIAGNTGNATVDSEQTVNNPVAIVDHQTGHIEFLYCVNYARCFSMRSIDDGRTWSDPVEITATFESFRSQIDWKVLATGPGHGIQLPSGRLVVPVWLAYGGARDHHPSVTATIFSDDHGKTWQAGDIAVPNTIPATLADETAKTYPVDDPNESIMALTPEGQVILLTRNESLASRKLITVSADGASHWSDPKFHPQLWEPICMASLLTVPAQDPFLVYCCPRSVARDKDGMEVPGGRGRRENLSLQVSRDSGVNWSAPKTLEAGKSAYSDLATLPDGTILCLYEADTRLIVARIPQNWLTSPE